VLEKWVFVLPSVFLGLAFALARGDRGRLLTATRPTLLSFFSFSWKAFTMLLLAQFRWIL
jgi:hypothetical protein